MNWLKKYALYFAWLVSLVGLFVSLFVSEFLSYEPCPLCWYQRIALFPLALLLGIAAYRNDRGIVSYALVLSSFGAALAFLQVSESHFPILQRVWGLCNLGETCDRSFTLFGLVDFAS